MFATPNQAVTLRTNVRYKADTANQEFLAAGRIDVQRARDISRAALDSQLYAATHLAGRNESLLRVLYSQAAPGTEVLQEVLPAQQDKAGGFWTVVARVASRVPERKRKRNYADKAGVPESL